MKNLLIALTTIFIATSTIAQNSVIKFASEKNTTKSALAENEYSKYEVFSYDLASLKEVLGNKNSTVDFRFDGLATITAELTPSYLVGDDFILSYIDEEGKKEYTDKINVVTLEGYTSHGAVRLTINDDYINGFLDTEEGAVYLESFKSSGDQDFFTLVNESDRVEKISKTCNHADHFESNGAKVKEEAATRSSGDCYEVKLSVAADYLMVADHGGIENVVNHIVGTMNNVQGNYEYDGDTNFDNGLEFNLVELVLSTCDICDPWTASTNFFNVFLSFENWSLDGGFTQNNHIGQFWTDRDFDNNYVGLAGYDSKKLCGHTRHHILQDFTTNASYLRTMVAHEIGHNFGADDLIGPGSIMSGLLFNTNDWDENAKIEVSNEILYQMECLGTCGSNICDPVEGLQVINITDSSFELIWNAEPTDNFDIVVTNEINDQVIYTENISGNALVITPSDYTICERYLVEISKNCSADQSDKISVHFSSPVGQGCADFKVAQCVNWLSKDIELEEQSINASTWSWDFGDGTTSNSQVPEHAYTETGLYSLSLTVNDGNHSKEMDGQIAVLPNRNIPYTLEDGGSFESENVEWASESLDGTPNLWEKGSATGALTKDSTVWKTKLSETIPNELSKSILYSPRFDFTVSDIYSVHFDLSMDVPECQSNYALQMQYSVDNGTTWVRLGSYGDEGGNTQNWYNKGKWSTCGISKNLFYDQQGWILDVDDLAVSYDVSFLSGNSEVIFRYVFNVMQSSLAQEGFDGVMIDNFRLNSSGAVVVPLDLLYLEGENRDGVNHLNWEAVNMKNFDAFVLERSENGEDFEPVVFLSSEGEESMEYFYEDDEIDNWINYYRLKMIDLNGEFDYSRVIKIYSEIEENVIAMVPNPNSSGSLEFKSDSEANYDRIQIFNYVGQLILETPYKQEIDISRLSQGSYIVNLLSDNQLKEVKKLQVI